MLQPHVYAFWPTAQHFSLCLDNKVEIGERNDHLDTVSVLCEERNETIWLRF